MIWWLAIALAGDPEPTPDDDTDDAGAEEPEPEPAPAPAPVPDPRDADIFGTPAPSDPRDADIFGTPAPSDPRDADVFGTPAPSPSETPSGPAGLSDPVTSPAEVARRLGLADDRFTIGGYAFLRLDGAYAEDQAFGDIDVRSPNLFDLFADARPNDRIRLYARGRLRHDPTISAGDTDAFGNAQTPTRVALDQLWLNVDVAHKVFVTAGKQRIKWGAGRLWNPTDFLAPGALDALAVLDERLGVGLVKVHVPIPASNTNVYAIAALDRATSLDEIGGALRVEQLLGPVEVALTGATRPGAAQHLGAQVSFPLWLFDVKGELAVHHGVTAPRWAGRFDLATFTLPREVDVSGDWIPQAVGAIELGLPYGDDDTAFLGVEYFYNGSGYRTARLYPWLAAQGQFTPFYLGRHYLAGYALLPGLGRTDDHTITGTVLSNLSDRTFVVRGDWSVRALTELTVNVYTQVHGGPSGGEFAFAVEVPPVPDVLPDGISVPRPVLDLGVGAQLRF